MVHDATSLFASHLIEIDEGIEAPQAIELIKSNQKLSRLSDAAREAAVR